MLVVCSDIHVLGSPLMSAEATRMQDLASEFSKIFWGSHPRPPKREGATSLPHSPPARPLAGRAPNLCAPQLFSRGCAPVGQYTIEQSGVGGGHVCCPHSHSTRQINQTRATVPDNLSLIMNRPWFNKLQQ